MRNIKLSCLAPTPLPNLPPCSHAPCLAAHPQRLLLRSLGSLAALTAFATPCTAIAQNSTYVQTNIISDGAVSALQTDPNLVNPWGVSLYQSFWIDSPGSGSSLVYDAHGTKSFSVTVPGATAAQPHGLPAGVAFNSDGNVFKIPDSSSATFLFGNLDGSIAAWNASTPQAVTVINNSSAHAAYTDIALEKNATGTFLLAANFASGKVDVFDSSFAPTHLPGAFADPALPAGFSPFGLHFLKNNVYVTYAEPNAAGRETLGAGLGYVDVFDADGNLLKHAISQGDLNAPWGIAFAPAGFGSFAGDLLVGNFGDGVINAYDPISFAFKGQLQNASGAAIANPGLWEIVFGANGVGDPNTLYFAAGINAEKDGLFGSIAPVPAGTGTADFSLQAPASTLSIMRGQSGSLALSLSASNGFNGPVTMSCSGLPAGTACSFTPSAIILSGTSAIPVTVTVAAAASTTGPYGAVHPSNIFPGAPAKTLALVSPLGLLALLGFGRRSLAIRGSLLSGILALLSLAISGCSSYKSQTPATTTPPATSQISVNATSGTITHSLNLSLTLR